MTLEQFAAHHAAKMRFGKKGVAQMEEYARGLVHEVNRGTLTDAQARELLLDRIYTH